MEKPKRLLKIDMPELINAFEFNSLISEISYFLNLDTGEVVMTTGEERGILEDIYENYSNPENGEIDWQWVLTELDIPEWQKEIIQNADKIEDGIGTQYISIPHDEMRNAYNDMVAFIETVTNIRMREKLEIAIYGKGAFRRFKYVLQDHMAERERWFKFQNERIQARVMDWLDSEGIQPV